MKRSVGEGDHASGWSRVAPIERKKKDKEDDESPEHFKVRAESAYIANLFLRVVKKFFSLFSSSKGKSPAEVMGGEDVLDDLTALRKLLQILADNDQSYNPEFTQQVSDLWHNLLEHSLTNPILEENYPKIKTLIDNIRIYPRGAEHTLGYYLSEYVGQEWLPFPFIDMISTLHKDYQEDDANSPLATWLSLLDTLIDTMGEKPEMIS